ncbi:MAG: septum formation initiator family protein [Parcubacteria group bacterium]
MARGNNDKTKASNKIISGLFFVAGLAVLVSIGISLGKETYKKRQVQKEIEGLQTQVKKLNQENGELNNLIAYFSTQEFQEKEAREKLNLQKENEQMVVLRKESENTDQKPATENDLSSPKDDTSPNWQKWLKFFFTQRN